MSYKELERKYERTKRELAVVKQELADTKKEFGRLLKIALDKIAELEEKLNQNSKNSSKPPSTDQKPNTKDNTFKKRTFHKGVNRSLLPSNQVDSFQECTLDFCPCCGSKDLLLKDNPVYLQQIEVPEIKPIVTQFTRNNYKCSCCGKTSIADLPPGTVNSVFGTRLMAFISTLTGVFHLSKRDVMLLVKDLYKVDICEGSVINIEERVSFALKEVYERIHHFVMRGHLGKHFDETSWRDKGKNHYVWVASTQEAACFKIDKSRSKKAFEKFTGILSKTVAITDRFAVYNNLDMPHQYCIAHLIRNFEKYAIRDSPDSELGKAIQNELKAMCNIHGKFRKKEISFRSRNCALSHSRKRLDHTLVDGLANGSDDLALFCDRLLENIDKLFTFSQFKDIEPTNNLAERDLRKLVLWRKKSYGTRSERGKRFVERITTVTETLKRSGQNILSFINIALHSFYSKRKIPLISPANGY